MLVVLRIASVRSDIVVFLNDPSPRLAGSIEKDAFTSLLCPELPGLAARADASPPPSIGSEMPYIGPVFLARYAFSEGGRALNAWQMLPTKPDIPKPLSQPPER
jgi:hypothetical protein